MKSIFGESVQIALFGEAHGPAVGVVINGLAPGLKLDLEYIAEQLTLRRPWAKIDSGRIEPDEIQILSGFFNGFTTGTPLTLVIANSKHDNSGYQFYQDLPRPSHADYTSREKSLGYNDYRGGGHAAGRLTAPIVVAGAICRKILMEKQIVMGSHIKQVLDIKDKDFATDLQDLAKEVNQMTHLPFPTLDADIGEEMQFLIANMAGAGDSVGGVLETAVLNMPVGIGEPFFNSLESKISQLLFAIPGVKGVEFGSGFQLAAMTGSNANDSFCLGDGIETKTNHSGGINGGISNGMPIIMRMVVKPTSSIGLPQQTLNFQSKTQQTVYINGKHDPAIIHRVRAVAEAMVSIALVDLFSERYGYLWQSEHD